MRYNKQQIIEANKDTLIYWLDNKGKWLEKILIKEKLYDKFIIEMSEEIETYQRFGRK